MFVVPFNVYQIAVNANPFRVVVDRGLKPGQAVLDSIGGAHKLQAWPHNILTGISALRSI